MKFGITGASSDIGIELYSLLTHRGYEVTKCGRTENLVWEIGKAFPNSDIDVLFHLAHNRKLTLLQNKEAVDLLISSFGKKIIYISSTSAHPESLSKYGKSKYLIQEAIEAAGGASIISGVIFGRENMSKNSIITQLGRITDNYPIVPLPFAGKSLIYFSQICVLSEALLYAAESHESGNFRAFSRTPLTLEEVMESIISIGRRSPRVVSLPDLGLSQILRFASRFTNFPGTLDSLLSLVNEMPVGYIQGLKTFPRLQFPAYK